MKPKTNGAVTKAAKTINTDHRGLIHNWPTLDMDLDLWRDSKGKLFFKRRGLGENGRFVEEARPVTETATLRRWLRHRLPLTQKAAMAMLGIRKTSRQDGCNLRNPSAASQATKSPPRAARSQDWVALMERESIDTAKPIGQLLAEKAGGNHPELLKLAAAPWGEATEQITFCVSGAERLALKSIAERRFRTDANLNDCAYFVMACALAHPSLIDGWLDMVVDYEREEGLDQRTFMRSRIWACEEYHKERDEVEED